MEVNGLKFHFQKWHIILFKKKVGNCFSMEVVADVTATNS